LVALFASIVDPSKSTWSEPLMLAKTEGVTEQLRECLDYPHHQRELLEESGIGPQVILDRGYRTEKTNAELGRLGFSRVQQRAPGLLIPLYSPMGEHTTYQIKPDVFRRDKDGKLIKYETPKGSEIRLDVHPSQVKRIKDPSIPLFITEGIKKGDCLVSHDQCAVALQGVWCWQKDGMPLRDWEDIKLYKRLVYVVFDSDVMTKVSVQAALQRLVAFLKVEGRRSRSSTYRLAKTARSRVWMII
jgi:Domain of unknown function (DUF3854)